MRETTRNFTVGLTAIVAFIGLTWLLLSFGELSALFESNYTVTLRANSATGIRDGSMVTMNGVPIGTVSSIAVHPGESPPVLILLAIREDVAIPATVGVTSITALIGVGTRVDLVLPDSVAPDQPTLAHDGTATLSAKFLSMEERLMAALDGKLDSLNATIDAVGNLAGNLNTLVAETGEGPEGEFNVRSAVRRLNQVLKSAESAFKNADAWLGDEQMRADARSAVWKANVLIEHATEALDAVAQTATQVKMDAHEVTGSLLPVLDQMSKTLEQVERLAADARSGQGTVGRLITNPDLYQSLTDAATKLKESMAEMQLLLRKIRDEGLDMKF
ncbi:MAG: MCE family protein [Phycisphaerales bacterium]|nr:MCE family protein [Phycisphaerales bacterium]